MSKSSLSKLINENSTLLKNVFLTLIAQLTVTFIVIYVLRDFPQITDMLRNLWFVLLLFFISIALMFMTIYPFDTYIRLTMFTLFSIVFGVLLSYLNRISPSILRAAFGGTIAIFIFMFVAGFALTSYGYDISWLGGLLLMSLFMLIVVELLSLCFGIDNNTRKVQLYVGLVIFSFYILYDTYDVVKKKDFITGAFSYYLDIINIFVKLVELILRSR